jgi:ribosomal protein S18 acetylase RimI-like enzyme
MTTPMPADALMVFEGDPDGLPGPVDDIRLDEVTEPDAAFTAWYRGSRDEFDGPLPEDVIDQLVRRDLEVFLPLGMRWFVARVGRRPAGYTSLLSLDDVGYLDGVLTMPEFRGRGIATATVSEAVRSSLGGGDHVVHLVAEEGGRPQRLYDRLGFRTRAAVESFTLPLRE